MVRLRVSAGLQHAFGTAILLILALPVFPNSTRAQEPDLEVDIHVSPDQPVPEEIADYLARDAQDYAAREHARIAGRVANKQALTGDPLAADRLLKETIDHIAAREPDAYHTLAYLYDARATLAEHRGDTRNYKNMLKRAKVHIGDNLAEHDPTLIQLNFNLVNAHIRHFSTMSNADDLRGRGRFQEKRDARRLLKKLHTSENQTKWVRDIAYISKLGIEMSHPRRLDRSYRRLVRWLEANAADYDLRDGSPRLIAMQLLVRMEYALGNDAAAEQIVAELIDAAPPSDRGLLVAIDRSQDRPSEPRGSRSAIRDSVRASQPATIGQFGAGDLLNTTPRYQSGNFVDALYCVTPEGRVADLAFVNASGPEEWREFIRHYIEEQIFAPSKINGIAPDCTSRYERFAEKRQRFKTKGLARTAFSSQTYIVRTDLFEQDLFNDSFLARAN